MADRYTRRKGMYKGLEARNGGRLRREKEENG
jgi:hypothetical protein